MHVSLLNKADVDAHTIANRINPAFTLRRYVHVFDDQYKAAAPPTAEAPVTAQR